MPQLRSLALVLCVGLTACATAPTGPRESILGLTLADIDGKPQALSQYAGKVLLIVNVASRCGYTPQYAGLEKLWNEYRSRGFFVLGVPSNDFLGQEPGSDPEIKKFCSLKYDVSFPMFGKVKTHGKHQAPLYRVLGHDGLPRWNFYKYVVGKDGKVRQLFGSSTKPEAPELRAAIDAALAE